MQIVSCSLSSASRYCLAAVVAILVLLASASIVAAAPLQPKNLVAVAVPYEGQQRLVKISWRIAKPRLQGMTIRIQRRERSNDTKTESPILVASVQKAAAYFDLPPRNGVFCYRARSIQNKRRSSFTKYSCVEVVAGLSESSNPTSTPTAAPTNTPEPAGTTVAPTSTPGISNTGTKTPAPTATPTFKASATSTRTPTPLPTVTVTPTPGSGGSAITINLVVSRTSCAAPCGVYFDGSATTATTTQSPIHDLKYSFNFGDPSATFVNRPSALAHAADGAVAGHVFENPGVYAVTFSVRDMLGNSAQQTASITVQDPNVVFSRANGGHTWCLSSSGNFSGCPETDPQYHLTDYVTRAIDGATLCAGNFTYGMPPKGPRRLLIRRGDVFVTRGNYHDNCNVTGYDESPIMIAPFGTGAAPILRWETNGEYNPQQVMLGLRTGPAQGITIAGISFEGTYDPTTGAGEYMQAGLSLKGTALNFATIFRNSFKGFEINVSLDDYTEPRYGVFADNKSIDWMNFGFFGSFQHSAIIGNVIEQHPNTVSGNWDGKSGCIGRGICGPDNKHGTDFPDHGAVRLGASTYLDFSNNSVISRNGWGGLGSQPAFRFASDGPTEIRNSFVTHNFFQPGAGSGGNSNGTEYPGGLVTDVVWDGNMVQLTGRDYYSACFATPFGGTTFRNNICLELPSPAAWPAFGSGGDLVAMFAIQDPGLPNQGAALSPMRIYNNSLISLDKKNISDRDFIYDEAFLQIGNGGTKEPLPSVWDVRNNLVYSPQLANFMTWWFWKEFMTGTPPPPITLDKRQNIFFVGQHRTSTLVSKEDHWGPGGQGSNLEVDPRLKNMPVACRSIEFTRAAVQGVMLSGDGYRAYATHPAFQSDTIFRASRIKVTSDNLGPTSLYCQYDPAKASNDYIGCDGLDVLASNAGTLTLAHDIRINRTQSHIVGMEYEFSPSTTSKAYVFDNSVFAAGDPISYDSENVIRTVVSIGQDQKGQFVTFSPALTTPAKTYICKWQPGATPVMQFTLGAGSPAIDAGTPVEVFTDYKLSARPAGAGWDIGAFEAP